MWQSEILLLYASHVCFLINASSFHLSHPAHFDYIQADSIPIDRLLEIWGIEEAQAQQMSHQTRGAGTTLFVAICPSMQLTPVSPDTEETV